MVAATPIDAAILAPTGATGGHMSKLTHPEPQQQLADALQAGALCAQRVAVTARQQNVDAAATLAAFEKAIEALRQMRDIARDGGR
jgi:hypothetical protein